ncbi:MAG TPA: ABC transporter ATP-binding protein, partial [Elusimicrobia bacterium]|nr:ABC transporter ATP-binding protein [Elusimicrobiota bacterium]
MSMLCTLLKPSSGEAYVNGYNVVSEEAKVRQSIGIIFQDPSLDERLTAWENLKFHSLIYGIRKELIGARAQEVLNLIGLSEWRNEIVRKFSGGMKRRLEIARGLLHYPKVLFLDEPTLGLDPQTRRHIWDYIHELREKKKITIFLTTHYLDEAENCDRIAVIDFGQIIALDTPQGLRKLLPEDAIFLKTVNDEKAKIEIEEKYKVTVNFNNGGIFF